MTTGKIRGIKLPQSRVKITLTIDSIIGERYLFPTMP